MKNTKFNPEYYINVALLMQLKNPRCKLPRPKLKLVILVTGWGEFLPIITVTA